MITILEYNNPVSTEVMQRSNIVVQLSEDKKSFNILKHRWLTPIDLNGYHISLLLNITVASIPNSGDYK